MSASSCRSCKSPYVCHLLLCPQREPQSPPALQEPFLRPIGRSSGPGVLPWVVVCTQPCVCPLEWNLCFPQSVELQQSSLTYIQSQMLWGPLLLAHTEEPSVGLDLSVLLENFYDTIILQFVGHPPRGYGFKYITSAPLLTSHGFFMSLVVEYPFRVDSSPFYQW